MADLHRKLGIAVGMHPIDDALPSRCLLWRIQARAARCDASLGTHAGHLGEHHGRTTHGARAQMHQVVVTGHPIYRGVLRHGGYDNAVLQRQAAHGVGREHRRWCRFAGRQLQARALGKPSLEISQPFGIPQA